MTDSRFGHNRQRSCQTWLLVLLSGLILLTLGKLQAEVILGVEQDSGLSSWEWQQQGVSLQLVQRLPDQTRAFFQGRGFSVIEANDIARACVFQSIFRNDGELPMNYDIDQWQIRHEGKRLPMKTREYWDKVWQKKDTKQAARIAFHWSLLPTKQSFQTGDYNWGMSSFGLLPGEVFDLHIVVTIGGKKVIADIPAIQCAADNTAESDP